MLDPSLFGNPKFDIHLGMNLLISINLLVWNRPLCFILIFPLRHIPDSSNLAQGFILDSQFSRISRCEVH